jgi:hypothetical protein
MQSSTNTTELQQINGLRTDEQVVDMDEEKSFIEPKDNAPIESNINVTKYDNNDFDINNDNEISESKKTDVCYCGKGFFYWYFSPLICDLWFSIRCMLYHWIHWFFALGMFIFLCTMIPLSGGLIVLACVGLVLFYLTFEIVIAMSRLEFNIVYLLVERDETLKSTDKWRLKFSIDNNRLPKCNECCLSGMRLERQKFIFTSKSTYFLCFYHLFLDPFITLFLSLSALPPIYFAYWITFPILISFSHQHHIDLGYWDIKGLGDAFGAMIAGIVILPLSLRLCNVCAIICKSFTYWCLTDYYKNQEHHHHNPQKNLLSINNNYSTQGIDIKEDNELDNGTIV